MNLLLITDWLDRNTARNSQFVQQASPFEKKVCDRLLRFHMSIIFA
jgi:hypothetical protein